MSPATSLPAIPLNTNFIENAFIRAHAMRNAADDRDNVALHVSDLTDCARAVWARRNGKELLTPDDDTMRKFAFGKAFEDQMTDALIASGHAFTAQDVIDGELYGVPIVGHVDFIIRDEAGDPLVVIETKTTTFYPTTVNGKKVRVAPTETKFEHRMQAATYALLLGAPRFCVVTVCRDSGMMAAHWFDAKNYVDEVRKALLPMAQLSKLDSPEPVDQVPPPYTFNAKTGKSWRCSYCNYSACEKNTNPAALVIA